MAKRVDNTATGSVDRRNFLKGAAAGAAGAASAIVSGTGAAQQAPASTRPAVARPTEADGRADFVPPEPREYLRTVCLRTMSDDEREAAIDRVLESLGDPPTLDYIRLNVDAVA